VSVSATATSDPAADNMKTIVQKTLPGDVPFPWSEKDPYRLPVSIDRVQKMLITLGERTRGWGGGIKEPPCSQVCVLPHGGWPGSACV
jgi:hypothetical protein